MSSRWDHLLDTKPVALLEHLLDQVGKLVAKDFVKWPLTIESLDLQTGADFEAALGADRPTPTMLAYREAFRLARWELEREIQAIDEYMRNRRYLEYGLAPEDRALIQALSRWLVEQLLALGEATEGRVKRPQMLSALERIERNFLREKQTVFPV